MSQSNKYSLAQTWSRALRSSLLVVWLMTACDGQAPTTTPTLPPLPLSSPAVPTVTDTILARLDPPSELFSSCWVAYSPTNYNPNQGVFPPEESIRQDLQVLHDSGFNGLVTYGADGTLGEIVPQLAQELGFNLIMGIWDPNSLTEREHAIAAATYSSTVAYVVGNEGLGSRYDLLTLKTAVDTLRQDTGKPVATTEEFADYSDPTLLDLGDWVFPNVHPFYAGIIDPAQAVAWTVEIFDDFRNRTIRPVMFKEVGLPTDGDPQNRLNEKSQAEYYRLLKDTDVNFVYFESFDQPWKNEPSVEPYWGLFKADRTPKETINYVCNNIPPSPTLTPTSSSTATISSATPTSSAATPVSTPKPTVAASPTGPSLNVFSVYSDANFSTNHFIPSGYMGDTGDISINEAWPDNAHSGSSSIKITYVPLGKGPNTCNYDPPCKWAGVYWQNPADNWGTIPNVGFDLSGLTKLTFWARGDTEARIEFKIGGITGSYPDSLQPARSTGFVSISSQWQQYSINLAKADLSYVIGGFLWTISWTENDIGLDNPRTLVFYLDDIRFEK